MNRVGAMPREAPEPLYKGLFATVKQISAERAYVINSLSFSQLSPFVQPAFIQFSQCLAIIEPSKARDLKP